MGDELGDFIPLSPHDPHYREVQDYSLVFGSCELRKAV